MFDHTTYTYIRKSNDIIWNKCTHPRLYTLNTNEIQNFALKVDDLTPIFKNSFFMFKKCIDIIMHIYFLIEKNIYVPVFNKCCNFSRFFHTIYDISWWSFLTVHLIIHGLTNNSLFTPRASVCFFTWAICVYH